MVDLSPVATSRKKPSRTDVVERLDNAELIALIRKRADEKPVRVRIDEL